MNPWYSGDFLRIYSSEACPRQDDWADANKQDSYAQQIVNHPSFVDAVQKVNIALNTTGLGFFDLYKFIDNGYCMNYLGRTPNPIFSENSAIKQQLNTLYILEAVIKLYYTEHQLRATANGFFNQTVHNFKKVIADKSGVQWVFYSAHDTSVMNYLTRLGLTGAKCIYENYLNGTYFNNQT